ncbi:hypothetical protein ACWDA3_27565 [Nonomuraea rubra]
MAGAAGGAGGLAQDLAEGGRPATVSSETAFLVDFLPVERRMLTRTRFTLDHVQYYCDTLKPWIARRRQLEKIVLRRSLSGNSARQLLGFGNWAAIR